MRKLLLALCALGALTLGGNAYAQSWGDTPTRCVKFSSDDGTTTTCICETGSDTVYVDTDCDQTIDADEGAIEHRTHATDCTALTTGTLGQLCWEQDDDNLYVCEPSSGTCDTAGEWILAGGAGGGGITAIWDCTTGDCNTPTIATGEKLDGGTATVDSTDEGILAPRGTVCTAATSEGQMCWDTDDDNFYIGDGAAGVVQINAAGSDTNAVKEFYWTASQLLPLEHAADSIAPIVKEEGTNVDLHVRAFDDTTDECVGGTFSVPSDAKVDSGNVTFRIRWYSATATTGDAMFDIRWHEVGDNESWDGALTTEEAGAVTTAGTVDLITLDTWTEAITTLGWAVNDLVEFELCRDADSTGTGTDNLVGDAYVIDFAVEIIRE